MTKGLRENSRFYEALLSQFAQQHSEQNVSAELTVTAICSNKRTLLSPTSNTSQSLAMRPCALSKT